MSPKESRKSDRSHTVVLAVTVYVGFFSFRMLLYLSLFSAAVSGAGIQETPQTLDINNSIFSLAFGSLERN